MPSRVPGGNLPASTIGSGGPYDAVPHALSFIVADVSILLACSLGADKKSASDIGIGGEIYLTACSV
jgi:hypothetical protein